MLVALAGCNTVRGYTRTARMKDPPPVDCVRQSLGEVPGVRLAGERIAQKDDFGLDWKDGGHAEGFVVIDRDKQGIILRLFTGWMDGTGCYPDDLRRGREIMTLLYERIHANCPGVPVVSESTEESLHACEASR